MQIYINVANSVDHDQTAPKILSIRERVLSFVLHCLSCCYMYHILYMYKLRGLVTSVGGKES